MESENRIRLSGHVCENSNAIFVTFPFLPMVEVIFNPCMITTAPQMYAWNKFRSPGGLMRRASYAAIVCGHT